MWRNKLGVWSIRLRKQIEESRENLIAGNQDLEKKENSRGKLSELLKKEVCS